MKIPGTLLLLSLFACSALFSQPGSLRGRIVDEATKAPLEGANLRLITQADTTWMIFGSTRTDGSFEFPNIPLQRYTLKATYIGYRPISTSLVVDRENTDIGILEMTEGEVGLGEVVVTGKQPPVVQLGDTTEFNARAFKTNPDASAEDLVTKMPTVSIEDGTVKAQGEQVQQVMVDGRNFFGGDPLVALRNIPAEVIDKIQVFDKMSDQAEFTGFDDGQSVKTMNIITRVERRTGEFGKLYGGYGDQGRYSAGGNVNSFRGDQRFSVLGLSNNINQQNFSMQDLLGVMSAPMRGGAGMLARGAMMRGGGGGARGGFRPGTGGGGARAGGMFAGRMGGGSRGDITGFLVGQQDGITTANSLGGNYSDIIATNLDVTASYFFNLTDNKNGSSLWRENFLSQDSSTVYTEDSKSAGKNYNHRLNGRVVYTMDESNSLIIRPQVSIQDNRSSSTTGGITSFPPTVLSQSSSGNNGTASGYSGSGNLVFRHRFETQGRTLSADVGVRSNHKKNEGDLNSLTMYAGGFNDTTNQRTHGLTDGYTLSSRVSYTEPLGGSGIIEVNYNPSYTRNTADTKAYRFDAGTSDYTNLLTRFSNVFESEYLTQSGGLGLRYRLDQFNIMAGVSYQVADLKNVSTFPFSDSIERRYRSILPNAMIMYNPTPGTNLRIFYRSSTVAPSVNQLQSAIDNSNPLFLSTGNPDLKQSTSHSIVSRFASADIESRSIYFLFVAVSYSRDVIGDATVVSGADSVITRGIKLNPGTQLTYPVNLDHSWSLQSLFTYGFPIDWLSSNLNLNTGFGYSWSPGLVNSRLSVAKTTTISESIVLASNISPEVDFTVSYSANYSVARYTLQSEFNDKYFFHTGGLKFNWIVGPGIVLRNELAHTLYDGQQPGLDQEFILWNAGIAKKFFEGDRGEVQVSVRDLLNKNQSRKRNVTDSYIENSTDMVLGRYVLVTFTYTIR